MTERRRISNCVSNSQLVPDVITEGIASVSALSAFVLFSFSNGHINVGIGKKMERRVMFYPVKIIG